MTHRPYHIILIYIVAIFISGCAEKSIQQMVTDKDVNGLIEKLNRGDGSNTFESDNKRLEAIKALEDIGKQIKEEDNQRIIDTFIGKLKDKDTSIRVKKSMADSLDKLNWKYTNNGDYAYYLIAQERWDELVKMGEPAIDPLIESLKFDMMRNNSGVRKNVVYSIEKIGPTKEDLIKALMTQDEETGNTMSELYIKMGDSAIDPLIEALKKDDREWRDKTIGIITLNKLGWNPRKMQTGSVIKVWNGGNGELQIENGLDWDTVVVLSRDSNKDDIIASIYIQSHNSYTMFSIPSGRYNLFFELGKDWDNGTKIFFISTRYIKFEDTFEFKPNERGFSVTLHPVTGGNAPTEEISENEFPNLHR